MYSLLSRVRPRYREESVGSGGSWQETLRPQVLSSPEMLRDEPDQTR